MLHDLAPNRAAARLDLAPNAPAGALPEEGRR
jgi:hypothetical protein